MDSGNWKRGQPTEFLTGCTTAKSSEAAVGFRRGVRMSEVPLVRGGEISILVS